MLARERINELRPVGEVEVCAGGHVREGPLNSGDESGGHGNVIVFFAHEECGVEWLGYSVQVA